MTFVGCKLSSEAGFSAIFLGATSMEIFMLLADLWLTQCNVLLPFHLLGVVHWDVHYIFLFRVAF